MTCRASERNQCRRHREARAGQQGLPEAQREGLWHKRLQAGTLTFILALPLWITKSMQLFLL